MGVLLRAGALVLAGAVGMVVNCGGDDTDTQPGDPTGSGGTGGGGQGNGGSGGGLIGDQCDPPCELPQFCSVAGTCLDEGQCAGDGDCPMGSECSDEGLCTGCNPPNLLIVLDRSCSMRNNVSGTGTSKWEFAVDAINTLTTNYQGEIRFGMSLFPDTVSPSCQQDAVAVPVGDDNETTIQNLLTASLVNSDPNFPNGPCVTNIDTALQQAATEPSFDDLDRESYVLLITDGRQANCGGSGGGGDAGTLAAIVDMHDNRGIDTFVLGFGSGVSPTDLNDFALAGGVPAGDASCTPDPCEYYKAEDGTTLDAALDSIAAQVSCDEADPM